MWGPDDSFHLNPMLLQNIIKSPYFQKCCRDITDWNSLVDQIYYDVKHVEPWAQGKQSVPVFFCVSCVFRANVSYVSWKFYIAKGT
jgi:pre-mRNA-splicing factor 38B